MLLPSGLKKCAAEIRRRESVGLTAETYAAVVSAWGGTCFLSELKAEDRDSAITLIVADPAKVFSVTNCVPCARKHARELAWKLPPYLLGDWRAQAAQVHNSAIFAQPSEEPAPPPAAPVVVLEPTATAEESELEPTAAVEPAAVTPAGPKDATAVPAPVPAPEPRTLWQPKVAAQPGGLYTKDCLPVRRDDAALLSVGRARFLAAKQRLRLAV